MEIPKQCPEYEDDEDFSLNDEDDEYYKYLRKTQYYSEEYEEEYEEDYSGEYCNSFN